jgi:hypothetical protein
LELDDERVFFRPTPIIGVRLLDIAEPRGRLAVSVFGHGKSSCRFLIIVQSGLIKERLSDLFVAV